MDFGPFFLCLIARCVSNVFLGSQNINPLPLNSAAANPIPPSPTRLMLAVYLKLLARRVCLILFLVGEYLFPTQQKCCSQNNQQLIICLLLPTLQGPGVAGMHWQAVPLPPREQTWAPTDGSQSSARREDTRVLLAAVPLIFWPPTSHFSLWGS